MIHVWQLYPHIEEAFSLVFSFRLASAPSLMVVTQERVGVARNDPEHSTHAIEMYHLTDQCEFKLFDICVAPYVASTLIPIFTE